MLVGRNRGLGSIMLEAITVSVMVLAVSLGLLLTASVVLTGIVGRR